MQHIFDYGPSEGITPYPANDISKINHDSLNRVFKPDSKHEERSNVARNIHNGEISKVDRKNYIEVTYYVGPEAFKAPISNINSVKNNAKNGPEFIDIPKEEFTTKMLPLDISADRIINTPKRKCPEGKKMDLFGTCKAVWEN
ncbi:hypothetical protein B7P43_G10851 [Cryptotermes secundus]|uniref:Uncharacterized protein n=1 Tax=Cryptotermes secundus TaxID=105785 RepID=A0A2J7Q229_9NEOP|nr:hypothetical protein B7P43_G10851 [Cryptotermes secundus]